MSYFDCDETDRAARLFFKRADRLGQTVAQPCRHDSGLQADGRTIVFRAGPRVLARYRLRADGKLRLLRTAAMTA